MLNFDNHGGFFNVLYTAVVALFGALAKEINDKAKDKESFAIFASEVILHGFSGWLMGLLATKYLKLTDITSITIAAGVGGLFGYDLIRALLKGVIKKAADIDMEEASKEDEKHE